MVESTAAMNFFCRLFGHTWWPETRTPEPRWNTTKDGHILVSTSAAHEVRHVEICKRCGIEREVAPRRHDADRPGSGETADSSESAA